MNKREQIVDAARELMRARRASRFSMRMLAEVAGVSIATPYNLFGSKQGVIAAVMDADLQSFRTDLMAEPVDALEVFFRAASVTAEMFEREPAFYKAGANAILREADAPLIEQFTRPRHALLREMVQRAVQEGFLSHSVNPDALAVALGQQFFAWIQTWATGLVSLEGMVSRTQYAFALALTAVATDEHRDRLLDRLMQLQTQFDAWSDASGTGGPRHSGSAGEARQGGREA